MADGVIRVEPVAGREAQAAAVLAASLVRAPGATLRQHRPAARLRLLRHLLTAVTRDVERHGRAFLAVADGAGERDADRVLGALLLMPPGSYPMTLSRRARMAPRLLRAALPAPRLFLALRRSAATRGATLPAPGDWWLLHTIGVHPRAHRRGVGRRLLRHGLAAVDATGGPCHLHTASPAAASLFGAFGFVTDGAPVEVPGGDHPHLRMVRPGR